MDERFRQVSHFHGDGLFGYSYQSLSRPRLTFVETSYRKTRTTDRKWFVDHTVVEPSAIETALAQEPVFKENEQVVLAQLTYEWAGRDRQREIGLVALMTLGRRGAVEWDAGKVRLWTPGDPRWPYGYPCLHACRADVHA